MNRPIRPRTLPLLGLALAALLLAGCAGSAAGKRRKPITRELMQLVEERPEIGRMLRRSIAEARRANPDRQTNPVQSLEEYYDYVDSSAELIPRAVLENPKDLVRDQILQSICYFYFLLDQPLAELKGKGLYNNSIQYYGPFSDWLRNFANAWGAFLDTEESWNEKMYREFEANPKFGLQQGWYEGPENWRTFNQFFARRLKSPSARPIAAPDDPSVVVSPADSVPQGAWAIDDRSRIRVDGGVKVKLATYYSVADLLGPDSKYRDAFAGGTLTHTFLNVNDYHRFHFAVGGKVLERRVISENLALEVSWSEAQGQYVPLASTGWQFSQTRGCVVLQTEKHGLVALIPMGMAQVSSVRFDDRVQVGAERKKGDPLGMFQFGGSDFVMLFQKRAGFTLTAPVEKREGPVATYRHLLMGQQYGRLKGTAAR